MGKVERFNRTLLDERAFAQPCRTGTGTPNSDHHCGHTTPGGHPPTSRVPNLTSHHTSSRSGSPAAATRRGSWNLTARENRPPDTVNTHSPSARPRR